MIGKEQCNEAAANRFDDIVMPKHKGTVEAELKTIIAKLLPINEKALMQ